MGDQAVGHAVDRARARQQRAHAVERGAHRRAPFRVVEQLPGGLREPLRRGVALAQLGHDAPPVSRFGRPTVSASIRPRARISPTAAIVTVRQAVEQHHRHAEQRRFERRRAGGHEREIGGGERALAVADDGDPAGERVARDERLELGGEAGLGERQHEAQRWGRERAGGPAASTRIGPSSRTSIVRLPGSSATTVSPASSPKLARAAARAGGVERGSRSQR